jgi:hypothetical protein
MLERVAILAAAVAVAAAMAGPAAAQKAEGRKQPPACAGITFRPLNPGMPDGEHMAGMYNSRFGRLELMGRVQAGQPQSYNLLVKGKSLQPIAGEIPKTTHACLKSKNVKVPFERSDNCVGPRYRVVVDSSGKQKLFMLFTIKGEEWALCQAGTPAGG